MTVRGDEANAAALAEALLAEGILQEADWDGRSITSSLGAGVTRWAGSHLGGQDLRRIDLGLFWTDNLQAVSGINPRKWQEQRPKVEMPADGWPGWKGQTTQSLGEPVGVLALQSCHHGQPGDWPHHRDIIAGPKVLELEAVRTGLGFQVLNLLADVLPSLVGAAFPHYAWAEARKYQRLTLEAEFRPELRRMLEQTRCPVSPEYVADVVPPQALHGRLKPEALRAARKLPLGPAHREIVDAACDVLGRFQALRSEARVCDASLLCAADQTLVFASAEATGMAAKLPTFAIRWSRRDGIPEVLQSYLRQVDGRGTNLAWCQAWVTSDPASIRRAARSWRAVTALVLRACRLAELLHTEES